MSLPTLLFIALGLSMDAFAVSVSSGITIRTIKLSQALKIAVFFGGFQAVMPLVGWAAGRGLRGFISGVDHWVAFGILAVIGIKMIYESFKIKSCEGCEDSLKIHTLFLLAIATSIDALAVGTTFAFLDLLIAGPVLIIGFVTFFVSLAGVYIGDRFGHIFENKIEIAGGVCLIAIGIKILIEHTLL